MTTVSEKHGNLRIDTERLMSRLFALGEVGALPGGGVCRLALSDEDRRARDLVIHWMRDLGLRITIDHIGNVVAVRDGEAHVSPVMTGSHIDTVATGGLYDGCLGVLAGLEVIATLNDAGIRTRRPLAVGFFTNEEGARFAPDMMGSGVHQGSMSLDEVLAVEGIDGATVGEALAQIGYVGETPVSSVSPHCFLELHVEQGPLLEEEGTTLGAVTGVQGISWTEHRIEGVSNHAGTTPMRLRHDAALVAASIATHARSVAERMGGDQVATVGVMQVEPNLVNVVARHALLTVDLRNTAEMSLREAEADMDAYVAAIAEQEGVVVSSRKLARFTPVDFDPGMIDLVERTAISLGHSLRRMPSGAGHDAQMFAPNCPTAMIFVPSRDGVSHNVREYTAPQDIGAGANVLLQALLAKSDEA